MHRIGLFVSPQHEILDLAGPLSAFGQANALGKKPAYELSVLSPRGGAVIGNTGVLVQTAPFSEAELDTVIFVGGDIEAMCATESTDAANRLVAGTARVASVCTGAFLLAETRQLDGRRATTHWVKARELQARHPAVRVQLDHIYVNDGHVWTSAGIAAGIDLAL
ncbi:MAG: AraC family transcriptional regulator, partial [Steroidobacteraceae bacterium]